MKYNKELEDAIGRLSLQPDTVMIYEEIVRLRMALTDIVNKFEETSWLKPDDLYEIAKDATVIFPRD